mmetsp:Transcript_16018/g.16136  ORF Transcript_16018/g.16136 Transcript_16018/m.16136 type:complete len:272 (-) Transcript_16018:274-1089(-)
MHISNRVAQDPTFSSSLQSGNLQTNTKLSVSHVIAGKSNLRGGVEVPYANAVIDNTQPRQYTDQPTVVVGQAIDEVRTDNQLAPETIHVNFFKPYFYHVVLCFIVMCICASIVIIPILAMEKRKSSDITYFSTKQDCFAAVSKQDDVTTQLSINQIITSTLSSPLYKRSNGHHEANINITYTFYSIASCSGCYSYYYLGILHHLEKLVCITTLSNRVYTLSIAYTLTETGCTHIYKYSIQSNRNSNLCERINQPDSGDVIGAIWITNTTIS